MTKNEAKLKMLRLHLKNATTPAARVALQKEIDLVRGAPTMEQMEKLGVERVLVHGGNIAVLKK
jgi:hypothetical protein